MQVIRSKQYLDEAPNSSTGALIALCEDGKEYIIKHPVGPGNEQGAVILISEYLGYRLAKRFNLPIPECCFIKITKRFVDTIDDEQLNNRMQQITGLCLGYAFVWGTQQFNKAMIRKVNAHRLLFKTILGLDQYLYNSDRFPVNPNMLFVPQTGEIVVIDYSHAIWPILDYEESIVASIRKIKEHVLYRYYSKDDNYMTDLVTKIYTETIDGYIETIPAEWFSGEISKKFLRQFLTLRRDYITNILKGESGWTKNANINLSLF